MPMPSISKTNVQKLHDIAARVRQHDAALADEMLEILGKIRESDGLSRSRAHAMKILFEPAPLGENDADKTADQLHGL